VRGRSSSEKISQDLLLIVVGITHYRLSVVGARLVECTFPVKVCLLSSGQLSDAFRFELCVSGFLSEYVFIVS